VDEQQHDHIAERRRVQRPVKPAISVSPPWIMLTLLGTEQQHDYIAERRRVERSCQSAAAVSSLART
jgi:hypothetical protein